MYTCIYNIYMYTCMHKYIYTDAICMYVYIYIHMYTNMHIGRD